jgi:hypothetical protein
LRSKYNIEIGFVIAFVVMSVAFSEVHAAGVTVPLEEVENLEFIALAPSPLANELKMNFVNIRYFSVFDIPLLHKTKYGSEKVVPQEGKG